MSGNKVCDIVLSLLEDSDFVLTSSIGSHVKGVLNTDEKLIDVIKSCQELELLYDPAVKERIGVCKRGNSAAVDLFYHKHKLRKSILVAFSKKVSENEKVVIQRESPFKYKVVSLEYNKSGWVDVPRSEGNFNSIVIIKDWALKNNIHFDELLYSEKPEEIVHENPSDILTKFIEVQPADIRDKMIFTSQFLSYFLNTRK